MFLATDLVTKKKVAIKCVPKRLLKDEMLDLMFDEIKIVQKVDHSHITRVFETCEDDQNYYIVMEFVEGGTLTDLLEKKSGSLEEQEACNIVR